MVLYPGAFKPAHQHAPVPQPLLEHPPGVSGWAMNRKLELESWTWKPISRSLWVTHVRVAMILPRVSSKYAVSRTAASPAAWASRSRG